MNRYFHDLPDWPDFQWDQEKLAGPLAGLRHRQAADTYPAGDGVKSLGD